MPNKIPLIELHMIKAEKKITFADVGVISELDAKVWNFNSDSLVNRAIDYIPEEEGFGSRFVLV